jgi:hypothetical protein
MTISEASADECATNEKVVRLTLEMATRARGMKHASLDDGLDRS